MNVQDYSFEISAVLYKHIYAYKGNYALCIDIWAAFFFNQIQLYRNNRGTLEEQSNKATLQTHKRH